jgi:hypothetical protein
MPVTVEIIKPFLGTVRLGEMIPGQAIPFSNFTADGQIELIVFRSNKDSSQTEIYKAKHWTREVDPSKLDGEDYERVTTLNHGETYYIEAKSRKESKEARLIRFTQE